MDNAASLYCLLNCLATIDTDDKIILEGLPMGLKITAERAETIFEAIVNKIEV